MTEHLSVRMWKGAQLPKPGIFEIDAAHTTVGFVARHLMVTQVRGRFENVQGSIRVAEDPLESTAEAVIDTTSITTGAADRDEHLRSADFLDVESFPTLRFTSTQVSGGDLLHTPGRFGSTVHVITPGAEASAVAPRASITFEPTSTLSTITFGNCGRYFRSSFSVSLAMRSMSARVAGERRIRACDE